METNKRWTPEPIRLARAETEARMASYSGAKLVMYRILHSFIGELILCALVIYLLWFAMWRSVYTDLLGLGVEFFDLDLQGQRATYIWLYSLLLVVVSVTAYAVFVERRSAASVGFTRRWWILKYFGGMVYGLAAFTAALGLTLMLCGGRIELAENIPVRTVLLMLGAFIIQGMQEEVIFRGFFTTSLARNHSLAPCAIITSLVFAMGHFFNPGANTMSTVNITLIGILFVLLFLRTQSLWVCAAFHAVWNFAQGNFYGLPVSGINVSGSVLTTQINQSRELFSGGEFGVEASIGTTVVITVLIVIESFLLAGKYRKYAEALEDAEDAAALEAEKMANITPISNIAPVAEDDIPDVPPGWHPAGPVQNQQEASPQESEELPAVQSVQLPPSDNIIPPEYQEYEEAEKRDETAILGAFPESKETVDAG